MKHKLARLLSVVLVAVLLTSMMCASALASTKVKLTKTTKVYKKASTSSKSATLAGSTKVTLTATSGSWGQIKYKGVTAYIPLKYLYLCNPVKVYVKESTTKVYSKPGSGKVATVTLGTTLYLVGVDGNYALVQNKEGGTRGYVKASALSTTKPSNWTPASGSTSTTSLGELPSRLISTTSPSDSGSSSAAKIEKVIYVALSKMGAPYVARAKGPDSFDCAGFTYYCYKKGAGVKLKDSSKGQGYDTRYAKVSINSLKRGDLVCFDTDESDRDLSDHVGIYLGEGWFIHASSAAGQVILSKLNTGYYKRVFSWGRRIFS